MPGERLQVIVPSPVAGAIRKAAKRAKQSVSRFVAEHLSSVFGIPALGKRPEDRRGR
jgi:hypothetical protein